MPAPLLLRSLLAVAILIVPSPAASQGPPSGPAELFGQYRPYRTAVPHPEDVLGHEIGSRHTMYHQQQAALDAMIAAAPDRVRTEVTGRTAEGKVMRLLIISSPANIARLDSIRLDNWRLADGRRPLVPGGAATIARSPAIVMLSHSIHGNEPAGFETAMVTAFTLLASDHPTVKMILDSTIVIINPSQNPDGHERFAAWSNSVAVGSADPAALEQGEPWSIQGRFNHYRFDMNRDLLAMSQAETRATAGAVLKWRPQVFVDLHSTTEQYFFPPAATPINNNLPGSTAQWLETIGRGNAAAFDARGWQYYVRDAFDLYYPGYWDSWPSLNGAIGMTFETDGGPELAIRKDDGTITTFLDGIEHHFVASMATLATAASRRTALLTDFQRFFASAMKPTGPVRRVVIGPGADFRRTREVIELLRRQGIEVGDLASPLTVTAAHDYLTGTVGRRTFPAWSFVIDMAQPNGRLAAALLEPSHVLDSTFASRQVERFERNRRRGEGAQREGYEFYDITAWSVPLTHGLDAIWTSDTTPYDRSRVQSALGSYDPIRSEPKSAYVIPAGSLGSTVMALALLRDGVNVAAASAPLRADGVTYPAGSFVVRVARNRPGLHSRILAAHALGGGHVFPVNSAFPDSGQVGVGSTSVGAVHAPKIIVLAGDGVSQPSYGDVWWYLEQELRQPFVPVDPRRIGSVQLDRYNVLIMPEGGYVNSLGTAGMNRIRDWVRGGGVVIAMGSAVSTLEHKEMGLRTPVDPPKDDDRKKLEASDTAITSASPVPFVSPTAAGNTKPEQNFGAIARASLDRTHWLTWGYERDKLAVMMPDEFMRPTKTGDNVVMFTGTDAVIAGFVFPGSTGKFLTGSAWATVERAGRGNVVAFAANPLFRGFWRGTAQLFANAVMYGAGRP